MRGITNVIVIYMIWVWLTAGMLAKTVQMSVLKFKKVDLLVIPVALLAGLLVASKIGHEIKSLSSDESLIGLPLGFALVIAFTFKDRLLPVVTEGTLFGYCLIASYLYLSHDYLASGQFNILDATPMLICVCISLFLIIYPFQVSKTIQTILMSLFLILSVYIGYELAKDTVTFDGSHWELFVIGYSYLVLVANVFYILNFIPIPGKRQSISDRLASIREHAKELEEKYVAVDSNAKQILLTIIIFLAMIVLDYLNLVSNTLLVSVVLSFLVLVHTPPEKSKFSPAAYYKNL